MKMFNVDVVRRVEQIKTFQVASESQEEAGQLAMGIALNCAVGWLDTPSHVLHAIMHSEEVKGGESLKTKQPD